MTSAPVATTSVTVPTAPTLPPHPYLADLTPVEKTDGTGPITGIVKISGTTYVHGVVFADSFCRQKNYVDYDLSRSYTTFVAEAGLPDTGRSDAPVILAVYLDGDKVFEQQVALGDVRDLNFSVTGRLRIRFEFTSVNTKYCPSVALGDPQLTK